MRRTFMLLSIEPVATTQSLYLHQSPVRISRGWALRIRDGAACRASQTMAEQSPDTERKMSPCCGFLQTHALGTLLRTNRHARNGTQQTRAMADSGTCRNSRSSASCRSKRVVGVGEGAGMHHLTAYTQYVWRSNERTQAASVAFQSLTVSSQEEERKSCV